VISRKAFLASLAAALAVVHGVHAQSTGGPRRIGVIGEQGPAEPRLEAFRQGLRALGYVEGQNILVEYRYLEGVLDRVPGFVTELLALKVDVLVVGGTVAARAAKAQTTTVPIVFAVAADPVASGLVPSLARPAGNATGMSVLLPDMAGKQLELLKAAVPQLARVAVFFNPVNPAAAFAVQRTRDVARAQGIELLVLELRRGSEIAGAFTKLAAWRAGGLLVVSDPMFGSELVLLSGLAATHRVPAIYNRAEFARAGGLLAYGPSFSDNYRRAASYVDRILKGARPADLPVEQPATFEFLINLKTARALGLSIPQSLLLRADEVIQ
jgi:putative tryptophan/tyrosine transport system substrate-binding protein